MTLTCAPIFNNPRRIVSLHARAQTMPRSPSIVEVFITQRQGVDPLPDQLPNPVFDALRIAPVLKTGREPSQWTDSSIGLVQQQRAGVGGDRPAVKPRHHLAAKMPPKVKARLGTLCQQGLFLFCGSNVFSINVLCHRKQPFAYPLVRYPG